MSPGRRGPEAPAASEREHAAGGEGGWHSDAGLPAITALTAAAVPGRLPSLPPAVLEFLPHYPIFGADLPDPLAGAFQ